MPDDDTIQFDPPAPVAYVEFCHGTNSVSVSDVPMLSDTDADVTLIPWEVANNLGVTPVVNKLYELEGFDGQARMTEYVSLEMICLGENLKAVSVIRPTYRYFRAKYIELGNFFI
jgi:hypothetical protein